MTGRVLDYFTAEPVSGAAIHAGRVTVLSGEDGRFSLGGVDAGQPISVTLQGYSTAQAVADPSADVIDIRLRPAELRGTVIDARSGEPLPGARVYHRDAIVMTDGAGRFVLSSPDPGAELRVKLAGYRISTVKIEERSPRILLEPSDIRALYLTHYTLGWEERREALIELVKQSELNAVVLDVKGDRGYISYPTTVPLAKELGAEEIMVEDIDALLARLKAEGIYTIARIVVFKDDVLASHKPDLAVKTQDGEPYVDFEDLKWVDPFRQEVWEYNIQLAEEAARKGFDEIQFDYIRFPSDGVGGNVYSQESTEASRIAAISGFTKAANERLQKLGVFVAVDTFGWTMFQTDDLGIGQQLESIAPHVDFVCPMVYPSGWDPGSEGVADPVSQPYDIVLLSTQRGIERTLDVPSVRIRPWIQDFNDYGPSKKVYGAEEVRAQIQAARDAGAPGWMLWDAAATYTPEALDSEADAAPPVITPRPVVSPTQPVSPTLPLTATAEITATAGTTTTAPISATNQPTSSAAVPTTTPSTPTAATRGSVARATPTTAAR